MARVVLNHKKLEELTTSGEVMRALERKAELIVDAAQETYLARRVLPDHNDYAHKFYVERRGTFYRAGNATPHSVWVEFGAHAGGKTAILNYAPLRTAVDIVSSYH